MTEPSVLQKLWHYSLDVIYPQRCVTCGVYGTSFCLACQQKLRPIQPPYCQNCGYPGSTQSCGQCQKHPLSALKAIRSAYFFEGPLQTAIHYFKYNNTTVLQDVFAQFLLQVYQNHLPPVDVIIPVPLHKARYKRRGYNQSEVLGRALSNLSQLDLNIRSLRRHKSTQTQTDLGLDDRRNNVTDAFSVTDDALVGQSVLLIDDVCTTGATLDACATVLKQAQCQAVYGLTLARAP